MTLRTLGIGVLSAAAVLAAGSAYAGYQRQAVNGRLSAVATDSRARGNFHLGWVETDRGATRDRITVTAQGLDATRDGSGNLPSYNLWLTTSDGATAADFGALILTPRGRAGYRFNTRNDSFPEGVESVADFSGGTIEVRLGGTSVLTGTIPTFRGPGDDSGSGAIGVRRDSSRLQPAEGVRARGHVDARYANTPRGVVQQIRLNVTGLGRDGAPYVLVAIHSDGTTETELFGDLRPRGRFGVALAAIDTRRGDTIPGSFDLTDLSELSVEVRDKDGNVVLTGTFPTIEL